MTDLNRLRNHSDRDSQTLKFLEAVDTIVESGRSDIETVLKKCGLDKGDMILARRGEEWIPEHAYSRIVQEFNVNPVFLYTEDHENQAILL